MMDQVYRLARKFTLSWKEGIVRRHTANQKSILDYGCGTGSFLTYCKSHSWSISGVEPAASARSQAEQSTGIAIAPDLASLANASYDAITLWHVLEHVSDLHQTLDTLQNLLASSGTIFIAVPNHESMDSKLYKSYWAAYDVPRHLWHFSTTTMRSLLHRHGLKVNHILPMKLDAYYVSMLSEKYKHGSPTVAGYARAFLNARRSNSQATSTGQYSSLIYVATK